MGLYRAIDGPYRDYSDYLGLSWCYIGAIWGYSDYLGLSRPRSLPQAIGGPYGCHRDPLGLYRDHVAPWGGRGGTVEVSERPLGSRGSVGAIGVYGGSIGDVGGGGGYRVYGGL